MRAVSVSSALGCQGIVVRTVLIVLVGGLLQDDTVGSCIHHCYSTLNLVLIHDPELYQLFTKNFPSQDIDQATELVTNILKIIITFMAILLFCEFYLSLGYFCTRVFFFSHVPWIIFNSLFCICILHSVLVIAFFLSGSTIHNISNDVFSLAMVLYAAHKTYANFLIAQASETFEGLGH